jgi:hypothetical protein
VGCVLSQAPGAVGGGLSIQADAVTLTIPEVLFF